MNIQELATKIGKLQNNEQKELWSKLRDQFEEDIRKFRISYVKNRKTAFSILLHKFKDSPTKIDFIQSAIEVVISQELHSNEIKQSNIQNQIEDYYNNNKEAMEVIFQDLIERDEFQKLELEEIRRFTITKLLELNSFPNLIINAVNQNLFKDIVNEAEPDFLGNLNSVIREEARPIVNKIIRDLSNNMKILLDKESFDFLAIGYYLYFLVQKPLKRLLDSETEFRPEYFDEKDFHSIFLKYIIKIMGLIGFKESITEYELSNMLEEFYFILEEEEYNLKIDPFPWLS